MEEKSTNLIINQRTFSEQIAMLKLNIEKLFESILDLKEEDEEKFVKFFKLNQTFSFKLTNLLIGFIELEENILKAPSTKYYEIFFKDKTLKEFNENKLTRQVDSLLSQYFSVMDTFIRNIFLIVGEKNIDGLGTLYGRENLINDKKDIFAIFFEKAMKEELNNFKAYRDYSIHRGNFSIESVEDLSYEEYSINSYNIFKIKRMEGRTYSKDKKWVQKINPLFRANIMNLLVCVNDVLGKINQKYLAELEETENKQNFDSVSEEKTQDNKMD
jgi:hypothetical protein